MALDNRTQQVVDDLQRYKALSLNERLVDRGDVMKAVPMIVVQTMRIAADRIKSLESLVRVKSK